MVGITGGYRVWVWREGLHEPRLVGDYPNADSAIYRIESFVAPGYYWITHPKGYPLVGRLVEEKELPFGKGCFSWSRSMPWRYQQ